MEDHRAASASESRQAEEQRRPCEIGSTRSPGEGGQCFMEITVSMLAWCTRVGEHEWGGGRGEEEEEVGGGVSWYSHPPTTYPLPWLSVQDSSGPRTFS